MKLKLDSPGILEMLQSAEVEAVIGAVADSVAASIDETARNGDAIPVLVETYTSDRAAASVTLAHPAGVGKEAKYGTLTGAAEAAGLEVTLWSGE